MNGRMKTLKTMRNKLLLATAAMACLMTVGLSAKENLKIDDILSLFNEISIECGN